MNKLKIVIFSLLICLNSLFLLGESSVEIRSGAFFHQNNRFKTVYGSVNPCYEIQASTDFYKGTEGFVNFDWFTKKGHSIGCHRYTRANIATVSFGIKYPHQVTERISSYLGVGGSFSKIWVTNHLYNYNQKVRKCGVGCILKTGLIYDLTSAFFLDFFVDYLFQPMNFKNDINIGGLKTGVGIGFSF